MPPKSSAAKGTRRSTRASSHAASTVPTPDARRPRAQNQSIVQSPATREILGTAPLHDGSYGTNTFTGLDSMQLRGKRKGRGTGESSVAGSERPMVVDEAEDDVELERALQNQAKRKKGQSTKKDRAARAQSDFEQIIGDAVRELDTSGPLNGEEEEGAEADIEEEPHVNGKGQLRKPQAEEPSAEEHDQQEKSVNEEEEEAGEIPEDSQEDPLAAAHDSRVLPSSRSHRPPSSAQRGSQARQNSTVRSLDRAREPMQPDKPPYTGDLWLNEADLGYRGLKKTTLGNPNRTPYSSRRLPSDPPTSLNSKYGVPLGRASSVPLSERSYNYESFLEKDAKIRTPMPGSAGRTPRPMRKPTPIDELVEDVENSRTSLQQKRQPDRRLLQESPQEVQRPDSPPRSLPRSELQEKRLWSSEPRDLPRQGPYEPQGVRRRLGRNDDSVSPPASQRRQNRNRTPTPPVPESYKDLLVATFGCWQDLVGTGLFFLGLLAVIIVLLGLISRLFGTALDPQSDTYKADSGLQFYGWTNVKDNIGQFIPSPILHPLRSLSDVDAGSLFNRLDDHDRDIVRLRKSTDKQSRKISGLEEKLPSLVHLDTDKHGKPKVPSDFWYALKDLMLADDAILTLTRANSGFPDISKEHWQAVKNRLDVNGLLRYPSDGKDRSDSGLKADDKMVRNWDSWLRQNKESVAKILGPSLANQLPSKTEKELKAVVEKVVKSGAGGKLVTRDEFEKQMQKELASNQMEFRLELQDITNRIKEHTQQLEKLRDSPPSGIAKSEVDGLVRAIVRKELADAKIEAMARAGIKAHVADELNNQVNFFGTIGGIGAQIDTTYSSTSWKKPKSKFKSKEWLENSYLQLPPRTALEPWDQEGECFCAGPNRQGFGVGTNNISVLIRKPIVPQHLVVEHILPGATLDPGAMPKDIEVWANFDELNLRQTVSGWSLGAFPSGPNNPREEVLHDGFVKIGQFTYEKHNTGDGVQVFKLSHDLVGLNAATDHIVVRAMNNYGANHTCFYRLKLYGDVRERTA